MKIDTQIKARISAFTHELETLIVSSAMETVRQALNGHSGRRPPPGSLAFAKNGVVRPRRGPGRPPGSRAIKRNAAELEKIAGAVHDYLGQHGGLRIEELARGMGKSTKELSLPIRKLLAARQIRAKGHKRATQYFTK
jgi:hypothetical protein